MSSSKKKIKSDQIPKPINIKKEKSEEDRTLHPISYYIDDRLELVKQIFATLKPKTIMNLAPAFLKESSLDEVEELCLNELLCISTKRLKSIIENSRCPTDTESSDDSDVEQKEEHISLEEISSDSDIEGSQLRRANKLRKSSAKRADKINENKEPDGQISVLELLELQARARAIRSQLAMEPITKIEVKSDDDDDEEKEVPKKLSEKDKRHHKRRSNESTASKPAKNQDQAQANGNTNGKPDAAPTKKIKLKRNYRTSTKSPEKQAVSNAKVPETKAVPVLEQSKSRSASPDVIPIPAEPETLLISDSTDDESKQPAKKPVATTSTTTATATTAAPTAAVPPETPAAAAPAPAPTPAEESEPEEGEVREDSENEAETQPAAPIEQKQATETEAPKEVAEVVEEKKAEATSEIADTAEEASVESVEQSNVKEEEEAAEQPAADDEDQNDDVISIGGDLELIEELNTVEDEAAVKIKTEEPEKVGEPDEEDNDVILLNTSDDDHEKLQDTNSESWRTRYLKSSKVSQVLAASRLGKRVRDKIKKSNRAQKRNDSKSASDEKSPSQQQQQQEQQFTSQHEDGSMEQYQELLQHRQRKSSSSSKGDK
ncbi:protein IWS1 homolog [Drosophila navojoa]|uniref:protein IWS1 homolog n=1 Tax=Drosophila navojoa TaxID=7232 RepID=UPI0008477667|nr:protein IWS1 homolog [Drosophila navojoa]